MLNVGILKILGKLTYLAHYIMKIQLLHVTAPMQCLDVEGGGQH